MNEIIDKLGSISFRPIDEQIIDMLQRTWPKISTTVNESAIGSDVISPDVIRTAVYSHINVWHGTMKSQVLDEWMNLTPRRQNRLLIRAFPDGRTYDV